MVFHAYLWQYHRESTRKRLCFLIEFHWEEIEKDEF